MIQPPPNLTHTTVHRRLQVTFRAAAMVAGSFLTGTIALAQDDRATSFVAVDGPITESIPGGPLLATAYILVWVLLLGLVLGIQRSHQKNTEKLQELQTRIQSLGPTARSPETSSPETSSPETSSPEGTPQGENS